MVISDDYKEFKYICVQKQSSFMSKRTIIFQEHSEIINKEVDELFCFTILYNDKWSLRNTVKQSEFVVVAACRGLTKISLKQVNGKDFLFITDDISDVVGYPKQIDDFLSMQCDCDSKVTSEMLYHAILDSADELFPKMRLTDIYYNYKWLNKIPVVDIYTTMFDKYINDIFPNSRNVAIEKMISKFSFTKQEASLLFERWQYFYFIDYHPYNEWIPCYPKVTLTVEQFKETMSIKKIDVKKDLNTGLLYFEADEIRGKVLLREIPNHPMISQFITSNSKVHWLLHEDKTIRAKPIFADF